MKKLTLLVELQNGERKSVSVIELQTLTALNGAVYTIVEEETQLAPKELVLKRKDDVLVVEVGGETIAKIEGFYSDLMTATFSADGSFTPDQAMTLNSADMPVVLPSSEMIVGTALRGAEFLGTSPLF